MKTVNQAICVRAVVTMLVALAGHALAVGSAFGQAVQLPGVPPPPVPVEIAPQAIPAQILPAAIPAQAFVGVPRAPLKGLKVSLRPRVFRVKHVDPAELFGALHALLETTPIYINYQTAEVSKTEKPGMTVCDAVISRLGVDPRTRSLLIRGTERDLQTAADLIAVLDLPLGKARPKVKSLRVIELRFADAGELHNVLLSLELEARVQPLPKSKLMIVAGSETAMAEAAELIKELDIEGGEPAKPAPVFPNPMPLIP